MTKQATEFLVTTSEGDKTPYRFRVLRRHDRDLGYYVCVCLSGGSSARHKGIDVFRRKDIMSNRVDI